MAGGAFGIEIYYGVAESSSAWLSNRGLSGVEWVGDVPARHVGIHSPFPGHSASEWEDTLAYGDPYVLRTLRVTKTNGARLQVLYWQDVAKSYKSNWSGHVSYSQWTVGMSLFNAGWHPGNSPNAAVPPLWDPEMDLFYLACDRGEWHGVSGSDPVASLIGSHIRLLEFDLSEPTWWLYEVKFDPQYGMGGPEPMWLDFQLDLFDQSTGQTAIPSIPASDIPTREGYRFTGYYTRGARQGRMVFDENGYQVAVGGRSSNIDDLLADQTLYAGWEPKTRHVVVCDSERGYFSSYSEQVLWLYDGDQIPQLPDLSSVDPEFMGWYWDAAYTRQVLPGDTLSSSDGSVIYARFGELPGTRVTFCAEPAALQFTSACSPYRPSGGGSSLYYPDGTYAALPTVRKGSWMPDPYIEFLGWFTAADGGVRVNAGDTLATDTSHVLYAHWGPEQDPVAYTFVPNGGTLRGEAVAYTYYYYRLSRPFGRFPIPARDGYVFMGWYYDYELTFPAYTSDIVGDDEKSISWTLYAKWKSADASFILIDKATEI